ncbi:MAG: DUF7742 family protein [Paracoccaceae bacterium]|uniref:DUF7742 family protein n=1 Tax=Seohaeicola saemankumensis TaxID=481181 RepID=UPI001E4E8820|nr:hypothetical protein [Seohaeicola saemankumensis]MCD1624481.1 hypothetical protein [Seohaeicola saemankumensis]
MQRVMHGDLTALARHLLTVPPAQRWAACRSLITQADAADRYRKRFGRAHPHWGNGTLMAAARRAPLPTEPPLNDPAYASCLILALTALSQRAS